MPKKTKKEKLLAQLHRSSLSPVVIQQKADTAGHLPISTSSFSLSSLTPKKPEVATVSQSETHGVTKKNLAKTMILTALILIGEFLLARSLQQ